MLGTEDRKAPRATPEIGYLPKRGQANDLGDAHRWRGRFTDRRHAWRWIVPVAIAALWTCSVSDMAVGQTCTVSGSTVTLSSGSCAIAPNTTLNGTPAVHATTSAQITTNNVTVNPFNGGSIGGLAETSGIIIFSSGASISGNWTTAASAQSAGQIIFLPGSVINPPNGGGGTALLSDGQGSQITATGLSITFPVGGGASTGAKATNGGSIALNGGTSID